MTKKRIFLLALILTCLFVPAALVAQTVSYTWKKYNLGFAIPKTHEVKDNTADHFESGDDQTWLELIPYKDASASASDAVVKYIKESNFGMEVTNEGDYHVNNLTGYQATCTSTEYPEWYFWIIGYIDPNSENNYISVIWYKRGNDAAYNIAGKIAQSFKAKS